MYSVPLDRQNPGAIVLLLDQSLSMKDRYGGDDHSKAQALANTVNRLIRNLVLQCERGAEIRDYYHLGLIGYGGLGTGSVFGGALEGQHLTPISAVASYPLRMQTEVLPEAPDVRVERPVWVEPVANGGTPMVAAMDLAGSILADWANAHVASFPPIVVNVTDGMGNDGDPRPISEQLRRLHTADGDLLLFNVHISEHRAAPVRYPASPQGLPDDWSRLMFEMSSPLTPYMRTVAQNLGKTLPPGARGFMFNADSTELSEFLDIGTKIAVGDVG